MKKVRLSASVDAHLLVAAERAVKRGGASSTSAWINEALQLKLEHDRRLEALADYIAEHEKIHGEITADEIQRATRNARARARSVRGGRPKKGSGKQARSA